MPAPPESRHATACKVCRRRGRKCDRALPFCHACKQRGVQCEGYVTRWPGVAARGKLAGKRVPVLDESDTGPSSRQQKPPRKQDRAPRPNIKNSLLSGCDDEKQRSKEISRSEIDRLVRHYVKDLSSIFFLGDGQSRNPMFDYVLPLLDTVPSIRYAIAGSAACHIAAQASDKDLDETSLSLRVLATQSLATRFKDPVLAAHPQTLAAILMLAQLDMCSGDCIEFEMHLQGAVAICRDKASDHAANRHYFEQRITWLDILSSTTSTRLPYLTPVEIKAALGRFSIGGKRRWSYDVFPCPIDLCETLLDVSILYKQDTPDRVFEVERLVQASSLLGRLDRWQHTDTSADEPRTHLVEAWRYGIMAYLLRLFPKAQTETVFEASSVADRVLHHVGRIPLATSWSYASLWPIFQAAVSLGDEAIEQRGWIRNYLQVALVSVGCRHFSNALETLEFAWQQRGGQGLSATGTYGRTIMLG
ncbi:fungal specific transcription factor domain-containing protein [Sarocladium implicatum]|nr:fungal specific transcription factor domain-containing protein [Sarocladium implicatum]